MHKPPPQALDLTPESFAEFQLAYHRECAYPTQRYGQAFCNHFSITDPELFYEEDGQRAYQLILQRLRALL